MNEKAVKLVLTVLLLAFLSFSVSAISPDDTGLCLNPDRNTCQQVEAQQCCTLGAQDYEECLASYFRENKQASDYRSCDFGTCLMDCGDKFRLQCADPGEFIPLGVADTRIGLCEPGCCIITTTQNQNQCEFTNTQIECNAFLQESAVSSVQYSVGVDASSCTALCQGALPKGSISGTVKDQSTGFNLEGVLVEVGGKSATTNQDGTFIITGVTATRQLVKFSKDGYKEATFSHDIIADTTNQIGTVSLIPRTTASLKGYVKDANGAALEGVVVSYLGFEVITNQQGLFELTELPTGQLGELRAFKPSYLPRTLEIQIPTPTTVVLEDILLSQVGICKVNQPISSNLPQNSCKCGDATFETTNTGYCCSTAEGVQYSAVACEGNFKLRGFVSDSSQNPVFDVRVKLISSTGKVFFDDTSVLGMYEIQLPEGEYQILVTDERGRYEDYESSITINSDSTKDIQLTPAVSACDSQDPPLPEVLLSNIRGSKNLLINWTDPCNAQQYIVLVNGTTNANLPQGTSEHTITDLEWDKTFEITYKAVYNGRTFIKKFNATPGNSLCEGRTLRNSKFCLDSNEGTTGIPVFRVFCNERNQVATGPNFNCPEYRPGSICAGPDSNGETQCVLLTACSQGSIENPFGLFIDQESCEYFDASRNIKNFCYYDTSKTVVDKCYSCSSVGSCYDYQSKAACENNACMFNSNNCSWMPTEYSVLGKGICYQKNYQGNDQCFRCGPDSGLFENTQCTQKVCSALGKCYSDVVDTNLILGDILGCRQCTEETTCETFRSKESCVGQGLRVPPLRIPDDASEEDRQKLTELYNSCRSTPSFLQKYPVSDDACSLGRCNWNDTIGCFKDSNFDNQPDCEEIGTSCNRDVIPPVTNAVFPEVLSKIQKSLMFTVIDEGSDSLGTETKVCFGKYCCPHITVNSADSTDPFSPIKRLDVVDEQGGLLEGAKQGHNVLGFYSVDSRNNIESIQYKDVFIDTAPPNITIDYEVEDSSKEGLSNLAVSVTLDEPATCTGTLYPADQEGFFKIESEIKEQTGTKFSASYSEVIDFNYVFVVICTDQYGNTNTLQQGNKEIIVDRNRKILSVSPDGRTIASGNVNVEVKTTDDGSCTLRNLENNQEIQMQKSSSSVGSVTFTHSFSNLQSKTYNYHVFCTDSNNAELDNARLKFTVDMLAPQTRVMKSMFGVTEPYNKSLPFPYGVASLVLQCQDQNIEDLPGEFGCDPSSIRWCFTESITACIPNNSFESPLTLENLKSGTGNLCFFASDLGGNKEPKKCVSLTRDITKPVIQEININSEKTIKVNNEFFRTINAKLNVTGLINEKAVVAISVFSYKSNKVIQTVTANTTINSDGTTAFSGEVRLDIRPKDDFREYDIVVRAADFGGNLQEKTVRLAYDKTAPAIIEIKPLTSRNQTPRIDINTSKRASCKIKYPLNDLPGKEEQDFVSLDGLRHTVFIQHELPYVPHLDRTVFDIDLNCTDELNGNSAVLSVQFSIDKRSPIIQNFAASMSGVLLNETKDTKKYLMLKNLQTVFNVTANEPVHCRYSQSTISFNQMENDFLNFNSFSSFVQSDRVVLPINLRNYTYYIACEDEAGNNASLRTISIEARLNAPILMINPEPKRYVNSLTPQAKVKTLFNVDCFASSETSGLLFIFDFIKKLFGAEPGIKMKKDKQGNLYQHAALLSGVSGQFRGQLTEGQEYQFTMTCIDSNEEFSANQVQVVFTPDVTKPTIKNFRPESVTFSTTKSLLNISGTTEQFSVVRIYNNGKMVRKPILVGEGDSGEGDFDTIIALKNGTNIIKVEATDRAGNKDTVLRTVTYTNKGPQVVKVTPNSGIFNALDNITVEMRDNGLGIDPIASEVKLFNSAKEKIPVTIEFSENNQVMVAKLPDLENGDYEALIIPYGADIDTTMGQAEVIEFSILKSAPYLKIIEPQDNLITNKDSINFAAEVRSAIPGNLKEVKLIINNEVFIIKAGPEDFMQRKSVDSSGLEVYLKQATITDGLNEYYFTATDVFGNTAQTERKTITLDRESLMSFIELQRQKGAEKYITYDCELAEGIKCTDLKITKNSITMKITNQLDENIRKNSLKILACGNTQAVTVKDAILVGETVTVSITCPKDLRFESESDISVSFRQGIRPPEEKKGSIKARVRK